MEWKKVLRSPRFGEIAGVFLAGLGLLSAIAIVTYHPDDPSFFRVGRGGASIENAAGTVGANLSCAAFQLVGLGAYLVPVLIGLLSWGAFTRRGLDIVWARLVGYSVLLTCTAALFSLSLGAFHDFKGGPELPAGGWLGGALSRFLDAESIVHNMIIDSYRSDRLVYFQISTPIRASRDALVLSTGGRSTVNNLSRRPGVPSACSAYMG